MNNKADNEPQLSVFVVFQQVSLGISVNALYVKAESSAVTEANENCISWEVFKNQAGSFTVRITSRCTGEMNWEYQYWNGSSWVTHKGNLSGGGPNGNSMTTQPGGPEGRVRNFKAWSR